MDNVYCSLVKTVAVSKSHQKHTQRQMDDLMKKIKKLSAQIKSDRSAEDSSKDDTSQSQPQGAKRISRKRQKARNKKHRGQKRHLKYIPEDADSSSYTDCTDEEILRDYIENITTNMSGSDTDITLRKGAFLIKRNFSSPLDFSPHDHAEVDETDSFSESLLLTHSKKKRRKNSKRTNNMEDMIHMEMDGLSKLNQVIHQQYLRPVQSKKTFISIKKVNKALRTTDEDVEMEFCESNNFSQESSLANSSTDHSDTSSNSHSPGSEADDEGEESCVESSHIKPIIPWWEEHQQDESKLESSLSLISGSKYDLQASRYVPKSYEPMQILVESGGFVAYANHKIKKFVYNRDSTELSLHTANKKEQSQVAKLATLYKLHCAVEDSKKISKVVLTKTSTTTDADQNSLKAYLSMELKLRCRKNLPSTNWNPKKRKICVSSHSELMDIPLPDANLGHQMLRGMGWRPGHGLGKDSSGILNPIKVVQRPKHMGLGHT